jgi:gallate decarboxylase subunit D
MDRRRQGDDRAPNVTATNMEETVQEEDLGTIVEGEGRTQLVLRYEPMGQDLALKISGANEHVGAVALGEYDPESRRAYAQTLSARGHRDDVIARELALSVSRALMRRVVVFGGVHLDNITRDEQQKIIDNARLLADKFVAAWEQRFGVAK